MCVRKIIGPPALINCQLRRETRDPEIATCPAKPRRPRDQALSLSSLVSSRPEADPHQRVPGLTGAHRKLAPHALISAARLHCSRLLTLANWVPLLLTLIVAAILSSSESSTGKDTKMSSMSGTRSILVQTATVYSGEQTPSTNITRQDIIAKHVRMPIKSSSTR